LIDTQRGSVPAIGADTDEALPTVHIKRSSGWATLNARELWAYRELLFFLTWRDIKVRYKQTALGAAWAVLQPLMTMIVFSIIFGRVAKLPTNGIPYPIFAYCGLLPWQLFVQAVSESSNSLVANKHLLTKVYFPRLIIPLASVLGGLVDFCVAFVVLIGLMIYYGMAPTIAVVALPLFLLLAIATALAVGLWLSALSVEYRDVRYVIPFLTQFWLFATPVAYSSSLVPERWRFIYGLNPMAGVVEGFRWALLGQTGGPGPLIIVSGLVVVVLLFSGLLYFRRMERTFADIV
jgi:lipopolysaccharide transport system permease protein